MSAINSPEFYIQAGLAEANYQGGSNYDTWLEAVLALLRNTQEYTILFWQSIPVRFHYIKDLPFVFDTLLPYLQDLSQDMAIESQVLTIKTPNIKASWEMEAQDTYLRIKARWQQVPGGYVEVLNRNNLIDINRADFLAEWRVLLEQFFQIFERGKVQIADEDGQALLLSISEVLSLIPQRGYLYRSE